MRVDSAHRVVGCSAMLASILVALSCAECYLDCLMLGISSLLLREVATAGHLVGLAGLEDERLKEQS